MKTTKTVHTEIDKFVNEEITIHPFAKKRAGFWIIEARIAGEVVINGKNYEFNEVVEVEITKVKP